MLTWCTHAKRAFAVVLTMLALTACAGDDASPTAAQRPPVVPALAAARVQALAIRSPTDGGPDTLVSFGGVVTMRVAAADAAGRDVGGISVRWTSGDTTVAVISDDGALSLRRTGLVQLTASVGALTTARAFPVILIDSAVVRDVLDDPLVARLVAGLSPTTGARVQSALAASAGALAAGAAPTLRTLGASVAATLLGADDPADRAVLAVLELYMHQLQRALTLSRET